MGLIVVAAVDERAEARHHLSHGHVEVLSKGIGGKAGLVHVVRRIEKGRSLRLTRQVDAGHLAKAEGVLIFGEIHRSDHLPDLHQSHVAGVLYRPLHRQGSVSIPVDAVDIIVPDVERAAAVKGLIPGEGARLKRRRHSEGLDGGAGLIGVGDAEVLPQAVEDVQRLLVTHGVDLFLGVVFRQIPGIVQVKVWIAGLRQDLPVLGVHDHDRRILAPLPGSGVVFPLIIELLDVFFHHALHLQVNGGHHGLSVHRLLHGPLHGGAAVQIAVLPAVGAVESGVIVPFYAPISHISIHSEPKHVGGQGAVGVGPVIVILQPDPLDIGIVLIIVINGVEILGRLVVDPLYEDAVPAVRAVLYETVHRLLLDAKAVLQHLLCGLHVILIAEHGLYVQDHIVHPLAGGQLGAVPVHDIPPLVRDDPAVILLLIQHDLCIFLSAGRIDVGDPHHKTSKS